MAAHRGVRHKRRDRLTLFAGAYRHGACSERGEQRGRLSDDWRGIEWPKWRRQTVSGIRINEIIENRKWRISKSAKCGNESAQRGVMA